METSNNSGSFTFKTNINCGGCVAKITPILNQTKGIGKWSVDTTNKDKLLTVEPDGASQDEIVVVVQKAGFNIEAIK